MAEEASKISGDDVEENPDFSRSVFVKSMLEMYRDIESARCDCEGKLFPSGPLGLKSPDTANPHLRYELMILHCAKCGNELKRIYAVDTSSKEFHDEQRRAYAELPRWERHTQGNPINVDDEE